MRLAMGDLEVAEDVDFADVAEHTEGYSGSDLASLCRDGTWTRAPKGSVCAAGSTLESQGDRGSRSERGQLCAFSFSTSAATHHLSLSRTAAMRPLRRLTDDVLKRDISMAEKQRLLAEVQDRASSLPITKVRQVVRTWELGERDWELEV